MVICTCPGLTRVTRLLFPLTPIMEASLTLVMLNLFSHAYESQQTPQCSSCIERDALHT